MIYKIKHLKLICAILSILLLLPLFAGCLRNNDEGDEKDVLFTVEVGDVKFDVTSINENSGDNKIDPVVAFDREYKIDDNYSLTIGGSHSDRVVLTVEKSKEYGEYVYRLTSFLNDESEKSGTVIPVNGLVISAAKEFISEIAIEILENSIGSRVTVDGYNSENYEDLSRAIFSVSDVLRRINLRDPDSLPTEDSIVYLTSDSKSIEIPENVYAIKLKKVTALNYAFDGVATGKTEEGAEYLIFIGDYNKAFGEQVCSGEEKIIMKNLKMVASDTDKPYIIVGSNQYELAGGDINIPTIESEGVYLYDASVSYMTTPETSHDFVEMIVKNGEVIWIGDKNEKQVIPRVSGYLLAFVGKYAQEAVSFSIGEKVSEYLVDLAENPERFVRIGNMVLPVTNYNVARDESGLGIYTPEYGDSTGTNDSGLEIIVEDGIIKDILNQSSDTDIPKDGYVLSAGTGYEKYGFLLRANIGNEVFISPVPVDYEVTEFNYDLVNAERAANTIVIYDGTDGKKTTGTNEWGTELVVDSNSTLVEKAGGGNSEIPDNGYVISAHGDDNIAKLNQAYEYGAKVFLDQNVKRVLVVKSPTLKASKLAGRYEEVEANYLEAKENLLDLNYNFADYYMNSLKAEVDEINNLLSDAKFEEAIIKAESVSTKIANTKYLFTESFVIENRVAWYRPTETTEEQVENTIKRAKELNLTALYIETWYNGYTIFDKIESEYVTKNPIYEDLDVLDAFIKYGKIYGIEIHAWVETFFVGVKGNNNEALNNLLDLRVISKSGLNYYPADDQQYIFFNPYDERAQEIVYGVYDALIKNYDIDGLHHDYIRFPDLASAGDDYGYNDNIIAGFQKEYNTDKDPRTFEEGSQDWINWCRFRESIITEFVYNIYDMIQETGKDIKISCALFPNVEEARVTIFQNAKSWVDAGIIDEAFTMSYFYDVATVENNAKTVSAMTGDDVFFSVGIASFMEVDPDIFTEQITAIRKYPGTGVAIFSLNALFGSEYEYRLIEGQFRNPSIPGYKYEEVASVGAEDIMRKIDEIYLRFKSEASYGLNALKTKLSTLKEHSDNAVFDGKSDAEKAEIIKGWIDEIDAMLEDVESASFDDKLTAALNDDFAQIKIYLERSVSRLTSVVE